MDICGHVTHVHMSCVDMWKSDICGYMWICVVPRKGKENEIEVIKGDR